MPAVPSFAVDDGFTYAVPDALSELAVGDIVRIPLGPRRVRGYVTAIGEGDGERSLRDVLARSGKQGVFTPAMLETLRWAAAHYVAPLSTVLDRCAPPNLPRATPRPASGVLPPPEPHPLIPDSFSTPHAPRFLLTGDPLAAVVSAATPVLESAQNVIVTAPTVAEATLVAAALGEAYGSRVLLATSDQTGASRTTAWGRLSSGTGTVVVGTREVAFWGKRDLGLVVTIEEGRRAYKSPRTPTCHVRDVLMRRATVERFPLLLTGSVPTTDALAAGVDFAASGRRVWPQVDVVDRSAAGFGDGPIGVTALRAIGSLTPSSKAFLLAPPPGRNVPLRPLSHRQELPSL